MHKAKYTAPEHRLPELIVQLVMCKQNRLGFILPLLKILTALGVQFNTQKIEIAKCESRGGKGDLVNFFYIRDPQSMLDLVKTAETRITDEEGQALYQVIADLGDYIRRTAPSPEAIELLRRQSRLRA
jgi:hypothetical protein